MILMSLASLATIVTPPHGPEGVASAVDAAIPWLVYAASTLLIHRSKYIARRGHRASFGVLCTAVLALLLIMEWSTSFAVVLAHVLIFRGGTRGGAATGLTFAWSALLLDLIVAVIIVTGAQLTSRACRLRERELAIARLERRSVRARLQFLLAQLKPHFLFNALNGVLALLHDDPRAARAMVRDLTAFVSGYLAHDASLTTTVREELTMVEGYAAIEQRRFPHSFTLTIDVDPSTVDLEIPTFLLQPFIENAIAHGLMGAGGGTIRVVIARTGARLEIVIADSGGGSAPTIRERIGLSNSRERLSAMYGADHLIEIRHHGEQGTVIRVQVPAVMAHDWRAGS
jgi:signal transduction histidine kinase